jgi:hypothetical protein
MNKWSCTCSSTYNSLEECMTWKLIANRRWSYPKTRVSYKTQRERERERERERKLLHFLKLGKQGVVCHIVALPFTLQKYLKAKEELRKLKYFTIAKI